MFTAHLTETIDGDCPPFSWIQSRVRLTTHSEDIEGVLMGIYTRTDSRRFPDAYLIHDTHLDVPVYVERDAVSSIHPLTDHILELEEKAHEEAKKVQEEIRNRSYMSIPPPLGAEEESGEWPDEEEDGYDVEPEEFEDEDEDPDFEPNRF